MEIINIWKRNCLYNEVGPHFLYIWAYNMLNDWTDPWNNCSLLLLKAKSGGKKSLEVKKAGIVKNKDANKPVIVPGKL